MFSSFAALSSSSSIGDVKSTFTRWIGLIMWPEFVKKRETSLPLSARRAIVSAATGFFRLRVLFIKLLLLLGCFQQGHEVVVLSLLIFPHLKNKRAPSLPHPADSSLLVWHVRTHVKVVGDAKRSPALPQTRSLAWGSPLTVCSSARRSGSAFWYNCYTTSNTLFAGLA